MLAAKWRWKMPKGNTITIDNIEVKKKDIEVVKRIFRVTDNAEAIQKALDLTAGKIEVEAVFEKYKGTKIQKIYA
jgi:hypothetical protein